MLSKYSKKAQVGETVTWVVATVVIVAVLLISILLTKPGDSGSKIVFLEDKEKDPVSTMSITSFLQDQKNLELLNGKDYTGFEGEVKKLLTILPKPPVGSAGDWNFELYDSGEKKIEIYNYRLVTNGGQNNYFENNFITGQNRLRFWLECDGECKT